MTRVKLTLDPMPALRASTVTKVNEWFDRQVQPHRESAWAAKRAAANAGIPFPDTLVAEAQLRGITVEALANLILSKPDVVGARELHRQKVMSAIEAAATAADLNAISKDVDKLR